VAIHRAFPAAGYVYCEFEVVGARVERGARAPRITAGVVLRSASGETVREAAPTPIVPDVRGRLVRLVGLGVDGLPPGTYELQLSVRDEGTGQGLERREPFTLVTPR
jgi:hypothetical protein